VNLSLWSRSLLGLLTTSRRSGAKCHYIIFKSSRGVEPLIREPSTFLMLKLPNTMPDVSLAA
jgi:hypothetical protein